ncbi:hypothetical protein OG216_27410 [Streptomycetaceae bacterium NBC_01309]
MFLTLSAPTVATPTPTPPTTTPGTTPAVDEAYTGGAVTLTAGVVLFVLLVWLVQRRTGSGGVAFLAFTAGVLLAATQIGQTVARLGTTAVNSGVTAFTQVLS